MNFFELTRSCWKASIKAIKSGWWNFSTTILFMLFLPLMIIMDILLIPSIWILNFYNTVYIGGLMWKSIKKYKKNKKISKEEITNDIKNVYVYSIKANFKHKQLLDEIKNKKVLSEKEINDIVENEKENIKRYRKNTMYTKYLRI